MKVFSELKVIIHIHNAEISLTQDEAKELLGRLKSILEPQQSVSKAWRDALGNVHQEKPEAALW